MNKTLSEKIRNANVAMTLLIIMMHCSWNDDRFSGLHVITDLAVPTFFCMSSFLYFRNYNATKTQYLEKLKSRVYSLLVPFFVYNIILYFYYVLTVNKLHLFPSKNIPVLFLDVVQFILNSNPDPPLWYLTTLFMFIVIAPLFAFLIQKLGRFIFLLVFVGGVFFSSFSYSSLFFWIPEIVLGAYFAFNLDLLSRLEKKRGLINGAFYLSIVYIVVMCIIFNKYTSDLSYNVGYYYYRMFAPLIVLILYSKIKLPDIVVRKLAPMGLFFYCCHFPLKEGVSALINNLNIDIPFLLKYIIILITTLVVLYFIAKILSLFKPLWSILTGGR